MIQLCGDGIRCKDGIDNAVVVVIKGLSEVLVIFEILQHGRQVEIGAVHIVGIEGIVAERGFGTSIKARGNIHIIENKTPLSVRIRDIRIDGF